MEPQSGTIMNSELMLAQAHVYNHAYSYVSSMSLKCVVQLGIPDIIHNHGEVPMSLPKIIDALSLPSEETDNVRRLMRFLVHSGFFAIQKLDENEEEEGYLLTPSSRLLLKDDNNYSLSSSVLTAVNPVSVTPFHLLGACLGENKSQTAFEAAHGVTFYNFLEQCDPEFSKNFNNMMATDSRLLMSVVVSEGKKVFENLQSLVDVGGGTGATARCIIAAFPQLKCVVLDLPNVVANLSSGMNNLEFVGGDMFESIPSANAVLMKFILHNWSDKECVKILKRCKEAIPTRDEGGKVIIIDAVIEENNQEQEKIITQTQLLFDIIMMGLLGGKERSETEWKKIFLESGFTDYKITPISGFRSVIEVYP